MRFLNLTVQNVGVFRGQHQFDLSPIRQSNGPVRHLTLISGHNGAGKSTLFQALALGLHGSLALGERVSRQGYSDFLLNRIHRYTGARGLSISKNAGVALSFEYVQSGRILHIQIERLWQQNNRNVLETLKVWQDDKLLDIDPADYQIWLNDLIPPGLAPLCFFDAERLETLADPEQHHGIMGETLRRLLGLDLVERLHDDLEYYTLRRGGGQKIERLREEVAKYQANVDALNAQLNQLQTEAEKLAAEQARLEAELTRQEYRLAAEGGSYAARRPLLQDELAETKEKIEKITNKLRELSADLLPFALAPELCQKLSQRLIKEKEAHRYQIANELCRRWLTDVESSLQGDDLWKDLEVSGEVRRGLTQRLIQAFRKLEMPGIAGEPSFVHHLAEPEQEKLQSWITEALYAMPEQVRMLGESLRNFQQKQQRIEEDLQRVPSDELLAPIHAEIIRLQKALESIKRQRNAVEREIGILQFRLEEQFRHLQRTSEQMKIAQADEQKLKLVEQSKLALRAYQDALTRQRLAMLEEVLLKTFNTLCRKEHLLKTVQINPTNFHIQLQGVDNYVLGLNDFSAGERQLYALTVLWALRQVSGRQLPLLADTPLARLDEIHRWRFFQKCIPVVSDQVVLFTTDAEFDRGLFSQAAPYLARVYRLRYDAQREETVVTCEQHPVPQSVILYRKEKNKYKV